MAASRQVSIAPAQPMVACVAADGCSYLRALSIIEHIAGFEHTARRYAAAAAGCQTHGCWAASSEAADAVTAGPPLPIALTSVRPLSPPTAPSAIAGEALTVAFNRSTLIDIASDLDGNYVERRPLKLEALPSCGDPLGYLYRYWRDLRSASALQFSDIDTVHLARAGVIGKMHVVDVSSSDPQDFRFELFGYALPIGRSYERPSAHPVAIWADGLLRDYNTVRMAGAPRLHRMRSCLNGTSYHYTRLILPLLGKRGRVRHLLVAIRQEPGDGIDLKSRN